MGDAQTVELELPALDDLGPELRGEHTEIGCVWGGRKKEGRGCEGE
jgi:hypothetical protein